MMSRIYNVLLIAALLWGAHRFYSFCKRVQQDAPAGGGSGLEVSGDALPGLSPELVPSYQAASGSGATLKRWLAENAGSPGLKDPRKASIQLDYVMMISRDNPDEARQVFAEVKSRTPPASPVYRRVQKLASVYE